MPAAVPPDAVRILQRLPRGEIDVALCEDGRSVMVIVKTWAGRTVTRCLALPKPITEAEFDASAWRAAFERRP